MEDLICPKHPESVAGSIKRKEVGGGIDLIPAIALPTSRQSRNGVDPIQ
jgi:hypothetical protein